MTSNSIWDGTWSSDVHDDVHGIISVPLNSSNERLKINFDGYLHQRKTIYGFVNTPIVPKIGQQEQIKLDNIISLIDYTVINMTDDIIEGLYYCYYPTDNVSMIL